MHSVAAALMHADRWTNRWTWWS